MELKNSVSVILSKFNIVLQIMIYIFVAIFLVSLLFMCVMIPVGRELSADAVVSGNIDMAKASWQSYLDADISLRELLHDASTAFDVVWDHLNNSTRTIAEVLTTAIVCFYLLKFMLGLAYYPVAFIVDNFMSSCLKYGFMSAYFKNIRKSATYSFFYALIAGTYNLLVCVFIFFFVKTTFSSLGFFTFALALIFWLLLYSLRAVVFSGWIPYYLHSEDNKLWKSLKNSFVLVKTRWRRLAISFIMLYAVAYILVVVMFVPTFGVFSVLGYAVIFLSVRAVELTFYYTFNKMNYYLDPRTIVDAREIVDRTEFQE